ncbi:hypothetical protein RRG08_036053 [Elysia crispata]|uniref:Uncharacterized protein n=1 Tax=Elysia crispata TaxID=231223 RepID=A0AAE1ALI8_9GAST|nr:hypothetical protein RRG08_036053 [Elysia crispata]
MSVEDTGSAVASMIRLSRVIIPGLMIKPKTETDHGNYGMFCSISFTCQTLNTFRSSPSRRILLRVRRSDSNQGMREIVCEAHFRFFVAPAAIPISTSTSRKKSRRFLFANLA